MRVTDRRTDRQTDRILLAIPRLHYMQRGKNYKNRLRLAKVIVRNKMSRFLWFSVYISYIAEKQILWAASFVVADSMGLTSTKGNQSHGMW